MESRHWSVVGGGGGKVGDEEEAEVSGVSCWEGKGGHGLETFMSSLAKAGLLATDWFLESDFLFVGRGVLGGIGDSLTGLGAGVGLGDLLL